VKLRAIISSVNQQLPMFLWNFHWQCVLHSNNSQPWRQYQPVTQNIKQSNQKQTFLSPVSIVWMIKN